MKLIGALAATALTMFSSSALAVENPFAAYCLDKILLEEVKGIVDNGPLGKRGFHLIMIRRPAFESQSPRPDFKITCSGIALFSDFSETPVKFGAQEIDDDMIIWFDPTAAANPLPKSPSKTISTRRK